MANCNLLFVCAWVCMGGAMALIVAGLIDPTMSVSNGDATIRLGTFRFCHNSKDDSCHLYTSDEAEENKLDECDKGSGPFTQNGEGDSVNWCELRKATAAMIILAFFGNLIGIVGQTLYMCEYDFRKLSSIGVALGAFCGFVGMCCWTDFVVTFNSGQKKTQNELTVGAAFACMTAAWIVDVIAIVCLWRGGLFNNHTVIKKQTKVKKANTVVKAV